jgi:iron complex outermembrane receptor protein
MHVSLLRLLHSVAVTVVRWHFYFAIFIRGKIMNRPYRRISSFVLGVLFLSVTFPAVAQNVLEEIVVTAQKREQNIQDVGIAITAFTGDQMQALGVTSSFDIARYSPGVHISGNLAGQNTQFTIRGVTQNDFNDIIEAPTAVYLDEGYIPIAQAQTFAMLDIERVEILKGPQGTLFGRNATGGAVQYVSRKPSFDGIEGYIDLTTGLYDSNSDANSFNVEAALGGPLSDTAAARVAVLYSDVDGYLNNLYPLDEFGAGTFGGPNGNSPGPGAGADLGGGETVAVRGTLSFKFSDEVSFTVSVNAASSDMPTGPYQSKATIAVYDGTGPDPTQTFIDGVGELINVIDIDPNDVRLSICAPGGVDDGTDCGSDKNVDGMPDDLDGFPGADTGRFDNTFTPSPGADFFGYIDPDGDGFDFSGDDAFEDNGTTDTFGIIARLEWELSGGMLLTSITDFKDYEKLLFIDVDAAPVNQAINYAGVDATSFTQEIRLNGESDRIRWVTGFYYLNIDADSDNGLKFAPNSLGEDATLGGPFDLAVDAQLETDSYSLFGQIEYDLSDRLTLIGGVRAILEEKDYDFVQSLYTAPTNAREIHQGTQIPIGPDAGMPFTDSTSDNLWAGKLQLDFRPNDDMLWYFGVNRGVKAGSFNAQLAGGLPVPVSAIPYGEETLLSYEGGFKKTLGGGSTRINATAFYYDYKDYQGFLFTGVSGVVVNNDADNRGVELDIQSSPTDGLDLLLSAAWFDATVKDVPLRVDGPIIRDVKPVYAPEFQVTGLVRYEWPAFGGKLNTQLVVSYSDEYFYNLRNFDADIYDSYTKVDARVGWVSPDEHWDISFAVRNLTDERIGIQGFDLATLCGCNEVSYEPPRWYGITLRYTN